ncbi:DUF2147 domain-containing protein [Novosphingobium sp. Fuku2-ISO-50]|uniref:DUF2147 domain-containing protein n=1 Tax=Novosphingobium sp. Fuku2-ISO-50 TaxID=1739114 RepID=UPI0009EA12A0|nr:DUF2147 domain-containing protein [Novosphingobium sp. Fuku2-ISO-50]
MRYEAVVFCLSNLVLALGAAASLASHQPDPLRGSWRNPDGSVTIRIDECGARLCGWVTAASSDAIADAKDGGTDRLIGAQLFESYRRDGANHWSGEVFVPDLGHRFASHIVLVDRAHARIAGCLLGRFLCQSQIWQRV